VSNGKQLTTPYFGRIIPDVKEDSGALVFIVKHIKKKRKFFVT
jgi:hypothetical protein